MKPASTDLDNLDHKVDRAFRCSGVMARHAECVDELRKPARGERGENCRALRRQLGRGFPFVQLVPRATGNDSGSLLGTAPAGASAGPDVPRVAC